MKALISIRLLFVLPSAYASDVLPVGYKTTYADCRVNTVLQSQIFEEGLSKYEYPSLDVVMGSDGLSVSIGAMSDIEEINGDTIEMYRESKYGEFAIKFKRKDSLTWYQLSLSESAEYFYDEEGEEHFLVSWHAALLVKSDYETDGQWEALAFFDCEKPEPNLRMD